MNLSVRDLVSHWTSDLSRIIIIEDGSSYIQLYQKYVESFQTFCLDNGLQFVKAENVFPKKK